MRVIGYLSSVSVGSIASCFMLACGEPVAPPVAPPVVFSFTCDPAAGPDPNEAQQAVLDSVPRYGRRGHDEEMVDVARQVPGGWGGFTREDGQPAMYLVDTTKYSEAVATLNDTDLFRTYDFSRFRVKRGLWGFAQLYDWKRYIVLHGDWPDGLMSTDIDEGANRLVYGVHPEKAHGVEEFFSSLHLPCDLLLLEESMGLVAGQ